MSGPLTNGRIPRGIRCCNPLNIRKGDPWLGASRVQSDPDFVTFESIEYGIRAAARLLLNYQAKYGLRTLTDIIARWAPSSENDTAAYIANVANLAHINPHGDIELRAAVTMGKLIRAMCIHENGSCPITDEQMRAGLKLAGIDAGNAPPDFSNVKSGVASTAPEVNP